MRSLAPKLVALSIAAIVAAVAPAASAATFPRDGLGVNVPAPLLVPQSEADTVRDLDAAQQAGVTRVRFVLSWRQLEPGGPGLVDTGRLATVDRFVDLARARGIEPLPVLLTTPDWARRPFTIETAPPVDPADLGRFAGRMAAHFADRVGAYQVWNEPNLFAFWGGPSDPAGYTELLKAVYPAVKAVAPSAAVVTAGASPATDGLLSTSAVTYLEGIYAAGGKGFFDHAAAHPYTWGKPDAWTADVDGLHRLMVRNGDGEKRIWITEDGISTAAVAPGTTEEGQRDYLLDALAKAESRPWVGPVFVFGLRDTGGPGDPYATFGLLRGDFSPKVSYAALRAARPVPAPVVTVEGPAACRSTRRVTVTLRRLRGGERYVRVGVRVGTRAERVTAGRSLRTARVDLRGLGARRYRVRITARTTTGRVVRLTRTYRACVPAATRR
ncbi:cellulase family glycosylhydrolase [Patulibacter sp.]|uniref:cellulase family glycosylhydrolase n=1 Tax=Patulibacter sp. TaxID=1912859 RepID=UPI002722C378|nr:cellulase family glycosylhydrolase [Patulibacter sp.]MDO9409426.1 cellulase family glycosylhydrolase [Patulibacter sp.]